MSLRTSSEALAEGRGKAQANALRQTQTEMKARRIKQDGSYEMIDASDLKRRYRTCRDR